ncbi:hypothetical protein [Brevundimonas sp.]|uniref:hypothetical protein n=1 Tax=Brevundimonas sp. TaxID=1871086 RepID=UPI002FCA3108
MTLAPALLAVAALIALPPEPLEPCKVIEPTATQRQLQFGDAVAMGPFAIRTSAGQSHCYFFRPELGQCFLRDPQIVHITLDGRHVWFKVPEGRTVHIEVVDKVPVCRVLGNGPGD